MELVSLATIATDVIFKLGKLFVLLFLPLLFLTVDIQVAQVMKSRVNDEGNTGEIQAPKCGQFS